MREKLIDRLRETADLTPPICPHDSPQKVDMLGKEVVVYCKPFEQFQELVRETADALASDNNVGDKWVSTAERLPDSGKCVLICAEYGVAEGSYSAYNKSWVQFRWNAEDIKVTHWMPLPEPPKGE